MSYLLNNDFEKVKLQKLEVDVSSLETVQSASLERVWLERTGPLRPGGSATLKVQLRTWRGETSTKDVVLQVPRTARPGTYSLLVSDAASMNALEQRELRQSFAPRDLPQLLRALNALRRSHHVYARLLRPDDGAVVAGEFLPSLPSSVLSVLGGVDSGGGVFPVRSVSVWDHDYATENVVSGSRSLSVVVER
jgi:hypothetical protein